MLNNLSSTECNSTALNSLGQPALLFRGIYTRNHLRTGHDACVWIYASEKKISTETTIATVTSDEEGPGRITSDNGQGGASDKVAYRRPGRMQATRTIRSYSETRATANSERRRTPSDSEQRAAANSKRQRWFSVYVSFVSCECRPVAAISNGLTA